MHFNEFSEPVEHHTELNPRLWQDQRLRPEVRSALLRTAQDFVEFVEVPMQVVDIVLYGGNANYNYTSHSDIDLHLVVDFDSVECEREVNELFDSKRRLYKEKYNVKIRGIPVELYVENTTDTPVSSSYSILRDQWIREPDPTPPDWDHTEVARMTQVWQTILDHALKTHQLAVCRRVMALLRQYRQGGLQQPQGEFSVPNLVFKSLRNDRAIRSIQQEIDRLHDQELGVPA
jgi:hypothetical protein